MESEFYKFDFELPELTIKIYTKSEQTKAW
jgi:hypothetical protein